MTAGERGRDLATRAKIPPTAWISWVALAMMTTSSVASLRAAPTMAVYGLACVFLYLLPAIVFLLPTSLVSAELASGWEGGIYKWVSEGISKPMGFLAVWCQFAMTIFYYPSLLGFVASTLAYVFNPELASSGVWTACVIIVVYWSGVWISSRGTKGVAGLASGGLIIGTLIPGVVLVLLGMVFLGQGNESAAPMTSENIFPVWAGLSSLVLIVNNFLSYSGMEMNAVHVSSLKNPGKEFPKSMFLAMGLVLAIFILPALAISWIVPAEELSLTAGVMQAFDAVFANFGWQWLTPIVGIMLVTASLGGMLTWLAGPSKGLLLISRQEGYLPPFLQKLNKNGVQQNILVVQGLDHHRDRPGLRADPRRVQRVLDLLGDHHAGLPDHVPADVRGRDPAAPQAPRPPARLPRTHAGRDVRHRLRGLPGRPARRLHPAVAVRGRQRRSLLRHRRRRRARTRAPRAVPVLPVPQALVEAA